MSSKKNKRIKQELEEGEDIIVLDSPKRSQKRNMNEDELETVEQIEDPMIPRKRKKKIKSEEVPLVKEEPIINGVKEEFEDDNFSEINTIEEVKLEPIGNIMDDMPKQMGLNMPQNDIMELIQRMENIIPSNDALSYRSRLEKINWNDIVFKDYSVEECRETWSFLQKKIRHFRLLKEVIQDVKEYIVEPTNMVKNLYPEMPKKPPSTYNIFYQKKKPILISKNPDMDMRDLSRQISKMFKNLTPEKKAKYEKIALQLKTKYEEEMEVFYENHPEIQRFLKIETIKKKKLFQKKPRNPRSPFILYYENQLKKNTDLNHDDFQAKSSFKEHCKTQWKKMSVKKKVSWITKAEEDISRYEEETKQYLETHPNFVPVSMKHIISKEEVVLKERFCGKPDKPPNSAYGLFSRIMLQSDEIKGVNAKDRMNFIAAKWKTCSDEDKSEYRMKVNELNQQYKKDYEKYLESLPEDKKQIEIQKNLPKRRLRQVNLGEQAEKNSIKGKNKKITEPETPPISAFKYFANIEKLDNKSAKTEWKKLSEEEKKKYERKLVEIKRDYILEFEKFLNSLTKEELEEYSSTKQELKFSSDDFADDSSSSDTENDLSEDESD